MNLIVLHEGAAQFGGPFTLAVDTPREAFRALACQIPGFEEYVMGNHFRVVRRREDDEFELDHETLDMRAVNCIIDVYPAVAGGKGALGKILLGLVIAGAAIAFAPGAIGAIGAGGASFTAAVGASTGILGITYGSIAAFGAMMAIGGIAMMFAPSPKAGSTTGQDQKTSFIVGSPVNSSQQGAVLAATYGRCLVGSLVGSSEIIIDQMIPAGTTYDVAEGYDALGFPDYPVVVNELE